MSVIIPDLMGIAQRTNVLVEDLDERAFESALTADAVALDIETTGLDWQEDRIGTVQIQIGSTAYVVRIGEEPPYRLKAIVEDASVRKILHHAMFDLRFFAHHWGAVPARVACTKIASKLADPEAPSRDHSLAPLLRRYLGIDLDKTQQTSEWSGELSAPQISYASNDVRYLIPLYERLEERLRAAGLIDLRDRCYAHLPTAVELEVGRFPDVYAY